MHLSNYLGFLGLPLLKVVHPNRVQQARMGTWSTLCIIYHIPGEKYVCIGYAALWDYAVQHYSATRFLHLRITG